MKRSLAASLVAVSLTAASVAPALADTGFPDSQDFLKPGYAGLQAQLRHSGWLDASRQGQLRAATYNASLSRGYQGELVQDLSQPDDENAKAAAEVIQRTTPDVVLLNDFDYDDGHEAADLFRTNYLAQGQNGQRGLDYPYVYTAPTNNGLATGADLDNNGTVGDAADNFGYGTFPGQHGMVIYSRYPIQQDKIRTFQNVLWKSMPRNRMPERDYSPLVRNILRLNSATTWDVPLAVDGETIHVVSANPGAPVNEDGKPQKQRNADEIRMVSDYVSGGKAAGYIKDDAGHAGGLSKDARFVVLGDLNADPEHGDAADGAADELLSNARLTDPRPSSEGAAETVGSRSTDGPAAPNLRTAAIPEAGTLRTDYALPSRTLSVAGSGVFWPAAHQDGRDLVYGDPAPSGNHRLVWVDVDVPATR